MNFLHPGRLWLLAGVVILAVAYVLVDRHRRQAIARYTSSHLHPLIAPDRLGWRRHVPPVLSILGLAVVTVGLAQPTQTHKVPRHEGVVVLAVDVSASMTATDVAPSRIEAAVTGATGFVKDVPPGIHIGLVAFDGNARLLVSPTTDHQAVLAAVKTLTPGPRTATGEGIYTSIDAIRATLTTDVLQAARAAASARIPVTTIAYGTPTGTVTVGGEIVDVPADTTTMQEVAHTTGGRYFAATTARELNDVYTNIQTSVGYTTEAREITSGVLGVALVAVVGAATLAFAWAARAL